MHNSDEKYMQRCLQLAALGKYEVAPNPMVGCVIVHQNEIIAEGFHQKYGEAHAEVNAINQIKDKNILTAKQHEFLDKKYIMNKKCSLYVSLEPCSHYGKTPPCADLIINSNLKKVFIGSTDPNPLVAGKGIEKLKAAGIEVVLMDFQIQNEKLNKHFYTFHQQKRPYVLLKWAQSKDGFIAPENPKYQYKLSNEISNFKVHQLRAEYQAILIGKNTALIDNPSLTTRNFEGKNPIRILIDSKLEVPNDYNIFNGNETVLVFNKIKNETIQNIEFIKLDFEQNIIEQILGILFKKNIQSLMVEGGTFTLNKFIENQLFDEIQICQTEHILGKGILSPKINMKHFLKDNLGDDVWITILKEKISGV